MRRGEGSRFAGRRGVARAALGLVLALAAVEAALQLASLWTGSRSEAWQPGAAVRILCVGDSHTYGGGVERDEAYPGQLQRLLDARAPGRYSVLNLGLPGMSTTQLRHRFGIWLQRYEPDVVILWAGVNDSWNQAETDAVPPGWSGRIDAALGRSRAYRLVRVWLHDRDLERSASDGGSARGWSFTLSEEAPSEPVYTVHHDGVAERIAHGHHEDPPAEPDARAGAVRLRVEADVVEMARLARAAGVPLVAITYPIEASWFRVANEGLRAAAARSDLALVESTPAAERIPLREREWLWGAHPGARIYAEIAAEVLPRLLAVESAAAR